MKNLRRSCWRLKSGAGARLRKKQAKIKSQLNWCIPPIRYAMRRSMCIARRQKSGISSQQLGTVTCRLVGALRCVGASEKAASVPQVHSLHVRAARCTDFEHGEAPTLLEYQAKYPVCLCVGVCGERPGLLNARRSSTYISQWGPVSVVRGRSVAALSFLHDSIGCY